MIRTYQPLSKCHWPGVEKVTDMNEISGEGRDQRPRHTHLLHQSMPITPLACSAQSSVPKQRERPDVSPFSQIARLPEQRSVRILFRQTIKQSRYSLHSKTATSASSRSSSASVAAGNLAANLTFAEACRCLRTSSCTLRSPHWSSRTMWPCALNVSAASAA